MRLFLLATIILVAACDPANHEKLTIPDEIRACACEYYTARGHKAVELYCAIQGAH